MKLNIQDFLRKNVSKQLIQPRRSQIYVGFQCHQKCGFCYYKNHLSEPMFPKEFVFRQIDLELSYGIKDFEITGGEPSECANLIQYCEYIKKKSPASKIAIITNGGLFKVDQKIWNFIDEVLISCHTPEDNNLVNRTFFPFGSTFSKVKKTAELVKSFKKMLRINTVVGTFNINTFDKVIDDIILLDPSLINILPINLFDDAGDLELFIDYDILRPLLKKQIDKIKKLLPNSLVFIRYIPYCNMEGYQQHIISTWQHIYDWFDWNPELGGSFLLDYLRTTDSNDEILKTLGRFGSKTFDKSQTCINFHYEKAQECLKCKYYLICQGVEKTKNKKIIQSIVPSYGILEKNIMGYIGTIIQDFYKKTYNSLA